MDETVLVRLTPPTMLTKLSMSVNPYSIQLHLQA
jgi:hypothetical protein